MRRVMVFGVFDGIHEGHRSLFRQARHLGDRLIAVTTHDRVVRRLKGKQPRRSAAERLTDLEAEPQVDEAVLGDAEPGTWAVVDRHQPHVIALGYDQDALRPSLEAHLAGQSEPVIRVMQPHEPVTLHSSLLEE